MAQVHDSSANKNGIPAGIPLRIPLEVGFYSMQGFISEDELTTFDGWLKYQCVDPAQAPPDQVAAFRQIFEQVRQHASSVPKVGRMKLKANPKEHRFAVGVEEAHQLWLTLWVRRSAKGEYFVMLPCGDRDWDPHTSYHLDGTVHLKSYGRVGLPPQQRQALTGPFKGCESLGVYGGYAPKGVGAICAPADFSGIAKAPSGVLGPRHGRIAVDLVEPGVEPPDYPWSRIVVREVFRQISPWVVITIVEDAKHP